jgi:hypothetical protein
MEAMTTLVLVDTILKQEGTKTDGRSSGIRERPGLGSLL